MFRFRRFSTRLLVLVLGLLVAALLLTYLAVSQANEENAVAHIESRLDSDFRVFRSSVDLRVRTLADSARIVSADWPIRGLYIKDEELDRRTLRSVLQSYAERLDAPVMAAFSTEGDLEATTADDLTNEHCGPFRHLVQVADEQGLDQASDFAYLNQRLHALVVVPLYAPPPNVIGWIGVAFPIDERFAQGLKETTKVEVTFASGATEATMRVLASTLPPPLAQVVAGYAADLRSGRQVMVADLAGEPYVTLNAPLPLLGDDPARITLQRSLAEELAPARELEQIILLISLAALLAASIIAIAVARGISRPVQQLAAHTRTVAAGDYSARIALDRADELGQLAGAFNQMTAGLAERDRVRDLLGKVVSPEIATQLLHSELKLGGEEREVTILFSDLRDFTGMSEKLPPTEVLHLLNRYLDRMSAIVERHGGVIDKFVGDAIMALFGAPVAAPDAARRALATAREMVDALAELNRELAAEGRRPLQLGIGINTDRVVAGNMGSKTRLNYTVIGDGVNLASRLESLTKEPQYATTVIVSESTARAAGEEATLRPLGEVKVKGKAQPVRIYAVDVQPRPWDERGRAAD